mmetsp:Transcript_45488/g.96735  ORF Transcript_45488/g.96735 Transcript_45488/m.96735 type:complete len:205 (+) Transcript_45488:471-1085(+)
MSSPPNSTSPFFSIICPTFAECRQLTDAPVSKPKMLSTSARQIKVMWALKSGAQLANPSIPPVTRKVTDWPVTKSTPKLMISLSNRSTVAVTSTGISLRAFPFRIELSMFQVPTRRSSPPSSSAESSITPSSACSHSISYGLVLLSSRIIWMVIVTCVGISSLAMPSVNKSRIPKTGLLSSAFSTSKSMTWKLSTPMHGSRNAR